MSLDVYLNALRPAEVYWRNITHNLNAMAREAGLYEALWRPEEVAITTAAALIPILRDGLKRLKADPERFRKFDATNGWGRYEDLVNFVADYLAACEANPDATVRASR